MKKLSTIIIWILWVILFFFLRFSTVRFKNRPRQSIPLEDSQGCLFSDLYYKRWLSRYSGFCPNPRFFPSLQQIYRGVAQKLLEISVGVSNMFSKHFLFPLTRGSLAWLKFRRIRFLSRVIAKKPHWTNCLDGPYGIESTVLSIFRAFDDQAPSPNTNTTYPGRLPRVWGSGLESTLEVRSPGTSHVDLCISSGSWLVSEKLSSIWVLPGLP